jgi:hypothetical protein
MILFRVPIFFFLYFYLLQRAIRGAIQHLTIAGVSRTVARTIP